MGSDADIEWFSIVCTFRNVSTGSDQAQSLCAKRVKRLMREEQIQGKVPKRFNQTTNSHHADPIAANVLDRDFTAVEGGRG
jgi:hypothetical protein